MSLRTLEHRWWFTMALGVAVTLGACGRAAVPAAGQEDRESRTQHDSPIAGTPRRVPVADAGPDGSVDPILAQLDSEPPERIREIPACNDLEGANQCTEVGKVMLACVGLGNIFEDPVTARLTDCLHARQGTAALCETESIKTCALKAIDATEIQGTVSALCDELFARCPPQPDFDDLYTPRICRRGLSSLRDVPRRDFAGCMRKHCDLRLCIGYLL